MVRIHILPPETARLIAAGEVIDRPASALRELIDNAIDAGATEISVEIQKGGIDLISVSDNGSGMSKEDVELSILEHATSKIEVADDLLEARTLGFRGEALASIAAVARLEIVSREKSSEIGWRLQKEPGKDASISPTAARQGTTVTTRGIFESFPARRQFLKRPVSEALLCRQIFAERAIAHPAIAFIWTSGADSEHFPKASLETRISLLNHGLPGAILSRFEAEAGGASITAIYANPSFHRKDRKYLQVFVNRRKVPEWGLASVLEYAFSEYLPGGMRPCAFLFAEIDPSQADFNIHPAKREVRIKNIEAIKSAFYAAFRSHLHADLGSGPTDMSAGRASDVSFPEFRSAGGAYGIAAEPRKAYDPGERAFWEKLIEESKGADDRSSVAVPTGRDPKDETAVSGFRYIGRAFGPFLLFEKDSVLYVLDQHAAHERILYDQLSASKSAGQPLLVPFVFECESESASRRLASSIPELERMGYSIEASGEDFIVNGVPAFLGERAIQALIDCFSDDTAGAEAAKDMVATMACRSAVKDGEVLDDEAARELIRKALELPFPRCPHGRPIWAKFDKISLYRMVGRITA
ncbi:MAG TPA: DNA mismatch repair endonuclease MutL [Rectinemataceae bacterium]|nr:DNA mismatch repair endonuclease MutL [Rectinemataceae bacterium]